jgi:hypothetical protein
MGTNKTKYMREYANQWYHSNLEYRAKVKVASKIRMRAIVVLCQRHKEELDEIQSKMKQEQFQTEYAKQIKKENAKE